MSDNQSIPTITFFGSASTNPLGIVNEWSVLTLPSFYRGVNFLAQTLASLPKAIYRERGPSCQPAKHPLNKILQHKANSYLQTPFVLFETFMAHAIIHGNGYQYIDRDEKTNAVKGLYNVNPQCVTPFRYLGQQWYYVAGGTPDNDEKKSVILPASSVNHLPGLGFDGMCGYPLIFLMAEALDLARNTQKFAGRYLRSGTQMAGAIEVPATATNDQVAAIQAAIKSRHGGISSPNGSDLMVLSGGAHLSNTTINPEQSQLLESRQFSVVDMCRILGVPPHVVYEMSKATWANVELMGMELVKYSLCSWIEKSEQELSGKLLTDAEQAAGYYVRYDVASLLRGDTKTETDTTLALVNGGLITANEGRARLEMSPLDDPTANALRIPVNFPVVGTAKPGDPPKPADKGGDKFADLHPIIEDVIGRVENKTSKAFESKNGKTDLVVWANVFAEQQGAYVAEALSPVVKVLFSRGVILDADRAGTRYAAAVRAKAANTDHKPLRQIILDAINPKLETAA